MDEKVIELNKILEILEKNNSIKYVAVFGSMAKADVIKDKLSDSDLLIVVADNAIEELYRDLTWTYGYGKPFAFDKNETLDIKTIRICFDNFERFDFVLLKETYFGSETFIKDNPFGNNFKSLYCSDDCMIDADNIKLKLPGKEYLPKVNESQIDNQANRFWYTAIMATSKIMRGDYLIGSHLALSLMQDTIVLQMNLRDIEKGTTTHRTGDKEGVEIFKELGDIGFSKMPEQALKMIDKSCLIFDNMAPSLSNTYLRRYEKFSDWLKTLMGKEFVKYGKDEDFIKG